MPRHFLFQQMPGKPLVVQHEPHMGHEDAQSDRGRQIAADFLDGRALPDHGPLPVREVELHVREVIADGKDHRMSCSCGYLSLAYADRYLADTKGCPIEYELVLSQERRRRLLSSAAGLSVSR